MGQENQGNTYYEVGDRVIKTDHRGNHDCIIIVINRPNNRYYIRYLDNYNVQGTNVEKWVAYSDIKLDKEYYRDLKIEQILDGDR
jgi:excinuclease UvrABC nuclease subunit